MSAGSANTHLLYWLTVDLLIKKEMIIGFVSHIGIDMPKSSFIFT